MGEDTAAEEAWQNALELDPGNGRIWNNFGTLCFGQSRFTEACQAFEKSVALIPYFEEALYNLRDTYEALGRTGDMEKCSALLDKTGV
jgi:Tfp pilus assembly protein PilF